MSRHEIIESQPVLPGLEEPASAVTPQVTPAHFNKVVWDNEDATDRWLEEIGGGPRRETLAVDPPLVPRLNKQRRHTTRGGRSYPERSGRDAIRELTDDADKSDTERGVPITREAQAALAQVRQARIRRQAQGDIRHQLALHQKPDNDR